MWSYHFIFLDKLCKYKKFQKLEKATWVIFSVTYFSLLSLFILPTSFVFCTNSQSRGHLYFRLDIILIKVLSKRTLNMYFSGMKIDPKYVFLYAFFLICLSCPFKNLSQWRKQHPFFQFCTFFAPLKDVRAYIAWSWKTTLITWFFFFLRGWYPTSNTSGPPGLTICSSSIFLPLHALNYCFFSTLILIFFLFSNTVNHLRE